MRESPQMKIQKVLQDQQNPPAKAKKIPARYKREEMDRQKTQRPQQQQMTPPPTEEEEPEVQEFQEDDETPDLTSSPFPSGSHFRSSKSTPEATDDFPPPPDATPQRNNPCKRSIEPQKPVSNNIGQRNIPAQKFNGTPDVRVNISRRRMYEDPEDTLPPTQPLHPTPEPPQKKSFFGFGKSKSKPQAQSQPQPQVVQTKPVSSKRGALKGVIGIILGMLLLVLGAELNGTINTAPILNKTLALLVYGHSAGIVAMVIGGILIFAGYSGIRASKTN